MTPFSASPRPRCGIVRPTVDTTCAVPCATPASDDDRRNARIITGSEPQRGRPRIRSPATFAQHLRRTSRDGQAAGVEHLQTSASNAPTQGDQLVALELDDELGAVLAVADAEQLGDARLGTRAWPASERRVERTASRKHTVDSATARPTRMFCTGPRPSAASVNRALGALGQPAGRHRPPARWRAWCGRASTRR